MIPTPCRSFYFATFSVVRFSAAGSPAGARKIDFQTAEIQNSTAFVFSQQIACFSLEKPSADFRQGNAIAKRLRQKCRKNIFIIAAKRGHPVEGAGTRPDLSAGRLSGSSLDCFALLAMTESDRADALARRHQRLRLLAGSLNSIPAGGSAVEVIASRRVNSRHGLFPTHAASSITPASRVRAGDRLGISRTSIVY